MKFIKRTSILVKTKRRFIVRNRQADEIVQCPQCVEQMIPANASAELFGIGSRAIYRLIEAGTIHFAETENNQVYVCPTSIGQALEPVEQSAPKLLDGNQSETKINLI